jgi:hypothetical protein
VKGPSTSPNPPPPTSAGGASVPEFPFPQPTVWFAPMPPPAGAADYMDLFDGNGGWENAAGRVDVFQLSDQWVAQYATDDELRRLVIDLDRRGLAVALEARPLIPTNGCGEGSDGFAQPSDRLRVLRRLQTAGATGRLLRFVAFDRPFAFGHSEEGPSACGWSGPKIARQVAAYIKGARSAFPDLQFGDVEPLVQNSTLEEVETWITTLEDVAGSRLAFFHLVIDGSSSDWVARATEVAAFCRSRGIAFGVVYAGHGDTDQAWSASAENRFVLFEAKTGGHPDDVVIQSGARRPQRLLPETQSGTLTHLLDRYFRTRTALDIEVGPSEYVGSVRAAGTLFDVAGNVIASASIRLSLTPLDRPGQPTAVDLGTRITDERGSFRLTFHEPGVLLHLGRVLVEAWFPGDARRWPAYVQSTITA